MTPERAAEIRTGLSPEVKQAIELLKIIRNKVHVGSYLGASCPIASGYSVEAWSRWKNLSSGDREVLIEKGWTENVYEEFIAWYDKGVSCGAKSETAQEREDFLRFELSQAA